MRKLLFCLMALYGCLSFGGVGASTSVLIPSRIDGAIRCEHNSPGTNQELQCRDGNTPTGYPKYISISAWLTKYSPPGVTIIATEVSIYDHYIQFYYTES